MITRHGYVVDDLSSLTPEELDIALADLGSEYSHLDDFQRLGIIAEYMGERKLREYRSAVMDIEKEAKLQRANEILVRDATRALRRAHELFERLKQDVDANPDSAFSCVEVEVDLRVPEIYYGEKVDNTTPLGVDPAVWRAAAIMANSGWSGGIIPNTRLASYHRDEDVETPDEHIKYSLWGVHDGEEPTTWAHDCFLPEAVERGDYLYCWPFHNLVSHKYFPLPFLCLIKEYDISLKISYSHDHVYTE